MCGCTFVKHDFSRVTNRRRPNIPKTFPKHSPNTQSATSRFACDGARSLVSRTSENGGLSTVRDSGLFSRQRTSFGHVARSDSPRFFAAFVGRFQQGVDVSFRHSAPTRTSLPAVSDTHTQLNPEHVHRRDPHRARRAQAARRAPRARPRARVRRRRAGETLRRHRTRCEVRARPIRLSDTRRRPRRTRRARTPPPERANCTAPDRRRRPRRDRRPRDAARRRFRSARPPTVRVFPLRATTGRDRDARRKRRARGPSPPRALRAVDVDTRTSAETRRGRGGALAFARPLPSDTTHAHETTPG